MGTKNKLFISPSDITIPYDAATGFPVKIYRLLLVEVSRTYRHRFGWRSCITSFGKQSD